MARATVNREAMPVWRRLEDWDADAAAVSQAEAGAVASTGREGWAEGTCGVCGARGRFRGAASMREGLSCAHCRCNARQRAAAALLLASLPTRAMGARVYATEQVTPLHLALRRRVGRLVGSEFVHSWLQRMRLSQWLWRQGAWEWVRREDVTALRFADASLDGVISLDVLEHVPDYRAALREFARVLKPEGVLVLTVPFHHTRAESTQIAEFDSDGRLHHTGEPEYHGDPLSGGVLCFHHFGWSLLDAMREAGFSDAQACRPQSMEAGLPEGQWVFRAIR